MPTSTYVHVPVCVCVSKEFKNKYYHLRSKLVDVLYMIYDM
jgi:hypothetical protein